MAALEQNVATGRRKTASARVFLRKGKGAITVNGKELDQHFHRATERMVVLQSLNLLEVKSKFDVLVTVHGGGTSGQAGAVRHGITRALIKYEREQLGVQEEDEDGGEGGNGEWHVWLSVKKSAVIKHVRARSSLNVNLFVFRFVIPAKAGNWLLKRWIPAFAGMTN